MVVLYGMRDTGEATYKIALARLLFVHAIGVEYDWPSVGTSVAKTESSRWETPQQENDEGEGLSRHLREGLAGVLVGTAALVDPPSKDADRGPTEATGRGRKLEEFALPEEVLRCP